MGIHRAIQEATNNLIEPLLAARGTGNLGFLSIYNQVLLQFLPPLLENHLLPRIAAMIVLRRSSMFTPNDAIAVGFAWILTAGF